MRNKCSDPRLIIVFAIYYLGTGTLLAIMIFGFDFYKTLSLTAYIAAALAILVGFLVRPPRFNLKALVWRGAWIGLLSLVFFFYVDEVVRGYIFSVARYPYVFFAPLIAVLFAFLFFGLGFLPILVGMGSSLLLWLTTKRFVKMDE
jgi:hypothetical protein